MKRSAAILLLAAHLFNLGGYLLVNRLLVYKSDRFIAEQIGKGKYDRDNLIEIKIPQYMPQIQNWNGYLKVSGRLQLGNGVAYNYVKIRITQDTMFVKCIPNYRTTKLLTNNVIDARHITSVPAEKKSHESTVKKPAADNKYNVPQITFSFVPPADNIAQPASFVYISIKHPYVALNGQPPELAIG